MATAGNSANAGFQLNVVFDGTWVIAPSVDTSGKIVSVDAYAPSCGHPQGATFNFQLAPNPWPVPSAYYLLDHHSHMLVIQRASGTRAGMNIAGISQSINHCVPARPMGNSWDLMISIQAGPDQWASGDTVTPQANNSSGQSVPCFSGKDVPTGQVSSLQTLSFMGVTGAQLCGAPARLQATIPNPLRTDGSLIFEGEIPYIPTLQHERSAISALAALAGLDLILDVPLPSSLSTRSAAPAGVKPFSHTTGFCGHAVIVLPQP